MRSVLMAAFVVACGSAQTAGHAAATNEGPGQAVAPGSNSAGWKLGDFEISGIADSYFGININHPADHVNALRNFDDRNGRMELNMAILAVDRQPHPIGIHLDTGAGRAFDIMGATEKDATGMRFFEQAYADVRPEAWKGLELDLGKFGSWAGAEVVETPSDWNYSRSLLFVWCEPYYHFGVRASLPEHRTLSTGIQLVSGWNNIITGATYKTVGVTAAWTPSRRVAWTNTDYIGPDENTTDRGIRNLYDTVLLKSGRKASLYLSFDYLRDSPRQRSPWDIYGIAGAGNLQLSRKISFSPRLEWLNDASGAATGTRQQIKEFTATGKYELLDRLSAWIEFRNDWSNQPSFERGHGADASNRQPTVLISLVAVIRPQR